MKNEKMAVLFENEAFVKELQTQAGPEQIRELFAKNGVVLSDEELAEFLAAGKKIETGELSTDELDNVAGGGVVLTMCKILGAAWTWSCSVYGSPEKAVEGITSYWYGVFTGNR